MIFSENSTSFSFKTTPLKSQNNLYIGFWLVLAGITETPPHIAIVSEGKYYSLSTRKVDCGTSLERFINTLERKHVPCLFINIKLENSDTIASPVPMAIGSYWGDAISKIYQNLQPLKDTKDTCLSPIKELFTTHYSAKFADTNYVFELLAIAEKQGLIQECIPLLCNDANSNSITLPKYTMEEIKNRIYEISLQITSVNP